MHDYDFGSLTPHEFEVLCADLLTASIGRRFERYKPGKDKGIDGRCFADVDQEYILQCKHWKSTPIEKLLRHLRIEEAPKVRALAPNRYFLTTSKPLSHTDKKLIAAAIGTDLLAEIDIFGREDLNDILSHNPTIEKRHYKLWIQSSTVLDCLLNNDVTGRSEALFEEIKRTSMVYVRTAYHENALEILEKKRAVILTGAPGVGKTTLAEQILLEYINEGFQLVTIAQSIVEAERLFKPAEKQIFHFDDFLGRNYLEALSGHEGNHIVQFIKRVQQSSTKRFVITSRSTILNQAKILIDNFGREGIESSEYELYVDTLSEVDKAHILYNHIWHSSLSSGHIEQIYVEKRYRQIIRSREFNPRLIRFMTDAEVKSDVPAAEYWTHVLGLLNDPSQIWEHPFEAQLDDFSRTLVILVVANSGSMIEEDLGESYSRYFSAPGPMPVKGISDFQICLRHVCGSFLSRHLKKSHSQPASIDLFNPSIGDFVLARLARDIPLLSRTLLSMRGAGCVKTVRGLLSEDLVRKDQATRLLLGMIKNAVDEEFIGFDSSFVADCTACFLRYADQPNQHQSVLDACSAFLLQSDLPDRIASATSVFSWIYEESHLDISQLSEWIVSAFESEPDSSDIEELASLCELAGLSNDPTLSMHKAQAAIAYFRDSVSVEFSISDIFDGVELTDLSQARSNLEDLASSALDSLGVDPDYSSIEVIVDAYDFEAAAHELISDHSATMRRPFQDSSDREDHIDDIFGSSDPRYPD